MLAIPTIEPSVPDDHNVNSPLRKFGNLSLLLAASERRACSFYEVIMHYSQYGQDALVGDVLYKGRPGVFVDIGARDGVKISNTFYLEKKLSWTGLAIEPHPDLYASCVRTRSCISLNVAVSDQTRGDVEFVKFLEEPLGNSGLLSTFRDRDRLHSIKHEIITVPCRRLSDLILNVDTIDYLDIDVEGHELEVLHGIDFSSLRIKIIGIEVEFCGEKTALIDSYLGKNGFRPFLHLWSDRFYSAGPGIPSSEQLISTQ